MPADSCSDCEEYVGERLDPPSAGLNRDPTPSEEEEPDEELVEEEPDYGEEEEPDYGEVEERGEEEPEEELEEEEPEDEPTNELEEELEEEEGEEEYSRSPRSPGASPRHQPCVDAVMALKRNHKRSVARGIGGKRKAVQQGIGKPRDKERYPQWAMDLVAMLLTSFHTALHPFIWHRCKRCYWSAEDGAWRSAPRPS